VSAATFHSDIRAGVRQRIVNMPVKPAFAWEGVKFDPTKGVPWVTEGIRPVSSVVVSPGIGGLIAHTVLATFTLHYPANVGTATLDAFAGLLMDEFRPGNSIAYATSNAVIQQTERMGSTQEPDWINCAVVITMIGHTPN